MTFQWLNNLKENILIINKEEQKKRRVYGEKNIIHQKTLRKSYFSRPKLLSDWEYQKQRKNQKKPTKDIQVKQFSSNIDYDKQWNKLKYEHKINRIIHYVKSNNLDNDIKKILIQLVKSRKIQVEYENGEIKNIINLQKECQE